MFRLAIVISVVMITTSALAQQQSASERALAEKLMQELQGGLNCSASLISVQSELAKANARIKELESKAKEPNPLEAPK